MAKDPEPLADIEYMTTGENNVISGRFIVETHEDHGEIGMRPAWMPNADPYWGMAVAHDLLEHFPEDDGSVEAELMALGACYWLRHESGWVASKYNASGLTDAASALGGDFIELYRHVAFEGFTLRDAGTVEPIEDENTDAILRDIARKGMAFVRDEMALSHCNPLPGDDELLPDPEECETVTAFCSSESRDRAADWIRRGYRRATERFDGVDAYSLAESVFGEIETRIDAYLKGDPMEGTEIEITVDLENYSVSIESVMGEGETDYCDECDGTGELDGEDEGNYHDCPEGCTEEGNDDCKGCAGKGYICPPVACHCDDGEISLEYRESI